MTAITSAPPSVVFDRDASTQFVAIYRAQSRTHAHITYEVRQEHRTGTLTCQCPAFTFRARCAHTRAVRALWWRNWWQGCDDAVLADAQLSYAQQQAEGTLTDEGEIAMETLYGELAAREEATA